MPIYLPPALPPGDPPRVNVRGDNNIYTYNLDTNKLISWSYPTSKFSSRFETINTLAISLDQAYERLDAPKKTTWDEYWNPYTDQWVCYRTDEDGNPIFTSTPGQAAHRNANINRYDQGLPYADLPPIEIWDWAHASLDVSASPDSTYASRNLYQKVILNFQPIAGSSSLPFYCSLYCRPTQNISGVIGIDRKLRYVSTFTLMSIINQDISAELARTNKWYYGCNLVIQCQIGWPGGAIKFALTSNFRNVI